MTENNTVASVQTAFTMESSGYSASQRRLLNENAKFRAQLKALGADIDAVGQKGASAGKVLSIAGHRPVAPWMASSAALRLTEGNITNNIRAAERFIATSKTLSTALQAAFPVIGAIAFMGVLGRLYSRVDGFYKKIDAIPEKLGRSFGNMNRALETGNDELQRQIDVTYGKILKLEGKPSNGLAIALDDARLQADKLSESLNRDLQQIDALMKANHISSFAGFMSGTGATAGVQGSVGSYLQKIAKLSDEQRMALGHGDTKKATAIGSQITATEASASRYAEGQIAVRSGAVAPKLTGFQAMLMNISGTKAPTYADVHGSQDANLNLLRGFDVRMLDRMKQGTLTGTLQHVQQQYGGMAAIKASRGGVSALDSTSKEFLSTIKRPDAYIPRYYAKAAKAAKATAAADDAQRRSNVQLGVKMTSTLGYGSPHEASVARYNQSQNAIANSTQGRAIADTADKIALMTGKITKLDYAQRSAARTTRAYTQAMDQYKLQMDAIDNDPMLNVAQKSLALSRVSARMDAANARYQIDMMKTQATVRSQTGTGAVSNAVGNYFNGITNRGDFAGGMATTLLGGANAGFAQMMIGNRGGWSNLFYGASGQAGQFAIGNVEKTMFAKLASAGGPLGKAGGFLGKILGHGGKIGTKSNPMYVIDANGGASKAAGVLAKLKLPTGGSFMHTATSSVSALLSGGKAGMVSGILGGLSKIPGLFAGGFASGGTIPTGKMALVGENGPELMYSGSGPHTVVPNHALGGGGPVYNIDARGTDPALVGSYVQHAMQVTHAKSVSQALALHHDNARRKPR